MSLKSCPICDSEEVNVMDAPLMKVYFVQCQNCGTRTRDCALEYGAIETWNTRVREDKIWNRIEKFKESLKPENQYDPALQG